MLAKRDPIFWAATAIFAVAVLLGALVDNGFLLLGVAAYLLRPTLHSLGFARRLIDERQLSIQYQASNVAFAVLVAGNVALILHLMAKNDHTWELVNAILLGAIAVRALAGVLMVGDPAVAGPRIVMAVGGFLTLFGAMEGDIGGVISHVVPGLLVVALGYVGRTKPRIVAVVVAVLVVALLAALLMLLVNDPSRPRFGTLWAFALIGAPLVAAAVCLWRAARPEAQGV